MRILDLFSGDGGCARGYQEAGFEVVGVDQDDHLSRYAGEAFLRADALAVLATLCDGKTVMFNLWSSFSLADFDAIHASPPCQHYSVMRHLSANVHPDLVGPTRELLKRSGKPWIMENVPGAPLENAAVLCGSMFKLATPCGAELQRHRLFETNWPLKVDLACNHGWSTGATIGVTGTGLPVSGAKSRVISVVGSSAENPATTHHGGTHDRKREAARTITVVGGEATDPASKMEARRRVMSVTGATPQRNLDHNVRRETFPIGYARLAMGIDWMPMSTLSQAIPPAYCRYIGWQLLAWLKCRSPKPMKI